MNEVDAALKEEEKIKNIVGENKRYFVEITANVKKVLGPHHLAYYANTDKMFVHVIQNRVQRSNWQKFVMDELTQRPVKWRDEVMIKKQQLM